MPCLNEADTVASVCHESAGWTDQSRHPRRSGRRRQRQLGPVTRYRRGAGARVVSACRARLRCGSDGRNSGGPRRLRPDGRRRRQLRFSRAPEVPAAVERRLRPGPGLPPSVWRWRHPATAPCRRCTAGLAIPRCRSSPIAGSERPFTTSTADAGVPARKSGTSPAALHRHGIRDGDDREGDAYGAAHRRSADYAAPGRSPIAPPHLRTFRDGRKTLRFLPAVQSRGVSSSGRARYSSCFGPIGYALAIPGIRSPARRLRRTPCSSTSLACSPALSASLYGLFAKVFAVGEGLRPPARA